MHDDPVIAVGLLTARDLRALGAGFDRVFPLDRDDMFADLLAAIDEADARSHNTDPGESACH